MIAGHRASSLLILASLAATLLLVLMPLPGLMAVARPELYVMTTLFWVAYQPQRFGLIAAWLAGVFMDVIYGTPLAEHGLALAVAAYVLLKVRLWFLGLPAIPQSLIIGPVLVVYEFMLFWIDGVAALAVDPLWRWLPVLSSIIIWPIWRALLERVASIEVS